MIGTRFVSVSDQHDIQSITLNAPLPEWIPLEIVAVRDQVGFFANGQFVGAVTSGAARRDGGARRGRGQRRFRQPLHP